jgi:hypothetical protein
VILLLTKPPIQPQQQRQQQKSNKQQQHLKSSFLKDVNLLNHSFFLLQYIKLHPKNRAYSNEPQEQILLEKALKQVWGRHSLMLTQQEI